MKQILLLTTLVFTFYLQAFGQQNVNCPNIKLNSPSEVTPIGRNMDFSVSLMGKFDNKNVGFKWTVSNGANFNGQNTSVISIPIDKNLAGQTITATVEIKGLPKGCNSSFSESREVETRQIIIQDGDQENTFKGDSAPQEYFWRIENLAIAVQGEKGSKGVILFKFTNLSQQKKSVVMKKKLLKMAKERKVSLDGIEIKIEKGKVYEITVEFVPAESINSKTLEIKGLPEGCNSIFTKSAEMVSQKIIDPIIPDKLLGKAHWNDVIARLINLSLAINNEQGSSGKIVFRVTNNSERNWATSQQKKILKSLKRVNIPKDRILMEIEKGDFYETEFIFIPPPKN